MNIIKEINELKAKVHKLYCSLGGTEPFVELDPTVPQHVKDITQDDIDNWNLIEDSEVIITENTEFGAIDDTQKIFNRNLSDAVQNGLSVLNTVITGEVTVNTIKVFLALHSSGFNKAYINGSVYKRTVAQEFNYTFPTFGKKFLVVYAVADSTVFYLAEGLESLQPIQPFFEGVPVTLLLVDINGAVEYQGDINKANTDGTNLIKIANWRDTLDVYDKAEVNDKFVNNSSETITTLEECYLQGNVLMIRYKGENGNIQNRSIDLSGLATIDIHINDASYNTSTNILTLTDNEGNTYSVDLSEFSIITNTDVNGITTLTQEAVTKLIVSKVGQTGDYNDLLNKPNIPAPVDISGKLDKPTVDGTWVVTKSGSTISYTDASTLGQNISNANLTWTLDRTQNLGTKKLTFTNGRFSVPTLEMEVTSANSVPNKIWNDGVKPVFTNSLGINKDLAFDTDKLNVPTVNGTFSIKKLGSSITFEDVLSADFDSAINQYFTNDLGIMKPSQFNATTYTGLNFTGSNTFQAGHNALGGKGANCIQYISTTTTVARVHGNNLGFDTKNSFQVMRRFAIDTTFSTQRIFVGYSDNWRVPGSNPTNVAMSTLTNILGLCMESGSDHLFIIHNDSTGPAILVDTGFVNDIKYIYEFTLSHSYGNNFITVRLKRIDTTNGVVDYFNHTITSDFIFNGHSPVVWCIDALNTASVKVSDYGCMRMTRIPYL